jgi:hypothetical protein
MNEQYVSPTMEIVEIEIEGSILFVSGENSNTSDGE